MSSFFDFYNSTGSSNTATNKSKKSKKGSFMDFYNEGKGLDDTRKMLAERDAAQAKNDTIKRTQEEAQRYAQEAEKANGLMARAGEFVFGGGLKEAAKSAYNYVAPKAKIVSDVSKVPLRIMSGYDFIKPEQGIKDVQLLKDYTIGGAKNAGQLASGTANLGLKAAMLPATAGNYLGEKITGKPSAQGDALRKANSFIDNNGVLNYEPKYANEVQKTGGDVAELASWFIPITRSGQVGKIEKAFSEIPKIAKLLKSTPKIVKSGGKLFYEVGKDAVDIAVLDQIRGKDWETIKEDAKLGAIGGGVLRGIGMILGKLGSKSKVIEEAIDAGKTTEDEIARIFDEDGLTGLEEAFALEPVKLKAGEFAPIVKEIQETTGRKLTATEQLKIKDDIERGISKEAIINDIVEPPKPPKLTPEPSKPKTEVKATAIKEEAKSQPLQEGVKKVEVPKVETPKVETGQSITAKKMNKRFADDKKMATEYDVIEINKKLDDATKRLRENPEKAISEAFSEGGSNVDRVATLTELFEKSIKEGDEFMQKQAFNKLKQLAPETAQTMNMFKALTEANPHFSYMSDIVDEKLKNLVLGSSNLRNATEGMKKAEMLTKAKKIAEEKISKDIMNTKPKITIKKAQDLLDSLLCK